MDEIVQGYGQASDFYHPNEDIGFARQFFREGKVRLAWSVQFIRLCGKLNAQRNLFENQIS